MQSVFLYSVYGELGRPNLKDVFERLAVLDTSGQYRLATDPAEADFVFITEAQSHQDGALFRTLLGSQFVRRWRAKAYVYCEASNPPFVLPGLYTNLLQRTWDPSRQQSSCYFGREEFLGDPLFQDTTPDLLFSFAGSFWTHPLRPRLARLSHPRAEITEVSGVFWQGEKTSAMARQRQRFREQIARTKFPLCPRGVGTNSFRLFEVMSAGRVPVIISDDWVAPPGPDWDVCAIWVKERDWARLPEILEEQEPSFEERAAAVRAAYAEHFALNRQWMYVGKSLERLRERAMQDPPRRVRHTLAAASSVQFRTKDWTMGRLRAAKRAALGVARRG